jgi:glucosyl-dolichyl phosphate glucuronosyltransferase
MGLSIHGEGITKPIDSRTPVDDYETAVDVSVVISTYNRCSLLARALESLLHQENAAVSYEILVVDNNSTDETRDITQHFIDQKLGRFRYIFEPKQGLSYARNAGIARARAEIIAFTDDDVRVSGNWVSRIKAGFTAEPSVDFLGGRVLPHWDGIPPAWLTRAHWTPLALLDYGDQPFYVDAARPISLIGANCAFRRSAFEQVGLFCADFQRVKNGVGSLEDHEMLLRLWQAGRKGIYLPDLTVMADVQPDRLRKTYHREWHTGHGRFHAILRSELLERSKLGKIMGVPAHLYRRALSDAVGWTISQILGQRDKAFGYEVRMRFFAGFAGSRWHEFLHFQNSPKPAGEE